MRTKNTFGIIFCIRRNKAKDGQAPIYARITVDGKRTEIAIKRNIDIKFWNGTKGFAKTNMAYGKELNTYLEQMRARLVECYQELQLKNKLITAEAIKNLFCGTEEKGHTLINLIEHHNAELSDALELAVR